MIHDIGVILASRYTDMESEDYSFYSGLHYILEHNISDLGYDLTFATEVCWCTLFLALVLCLNTLILHRLWCFCSLYSPVDLPVS